MKITGTGGASGSRGVRKTEKASDAQKGAFAQQLSRATQNLAVDGAALIDAPLAVGGIDALLAAQMVEDATEDEKRRRLVNYGEDLLDGLEEMRRAMALGDLTPERLEDLARKIATQREAAADPRLSEILDAIELRVEVELAKFAVRDGD